MVLYIFFVAALNLALGFVLAVYLGRRYRATIAAGDCWSPDAPRAPLIDGALPDEGRAAAGTAKLPVQPSPRPPAVAVSQTASGGGSGWSDAAEEPSGRTDLEAELGRCWSAQPAGAPHLSVALIELDDVVRLEQQHGTEVVERILPAVERLLGAASSGAGSLLPLPRQQFACLFPGADVRLAADAAERLRQTVQQAHLHCHQVEIPVTISCAVTAAAPDDTPGTLAQRAGATLQEAKRYGRNRTFLHDGGYSAPVVPPVFSLAEQHVML